MIIITHTRADGTLIDGSAKGDGVYDVLRGLRANWRYFPSIRRIGLGQSRDKSANTPRINAAAEALRAAGHEVSIEIDETVTRTFAEAEAERYERAEDRAGRMAGYADNAAARSSAAYERAHGMADAIPFGQPMMPGHHSYGRDRNYRARIESTYRRSFAEADKAEHYAHRAGNAETYQASREDVPTTLRRIEKLEAEQRHLQRGLDGTGLALHGEDAPATGAYAERLTARLADLAEQITYWQGIIAKAEESGVKVWTRADFAKGDYVKSRGNWYEIERVNPKSLSVPHGNNDHLLPAVTRAAVVHAMGPSQWTRKVTYDEVTGRKSAADMAELLAAAERELATA